MGAELGVTQAVGSNTLISADFVLGPKFSAELQVPFSFLCPVCGSSVQWLRERLALLMEDVFEGTELQKYHLVQGFNSHKTVCHVCPTVHLLICP